MQIGTQGSWQARLVSFDDKAIASMDVGALDFWRVGKPILQQIVEGIEMSYQQPNRSPAGCRAPRDARILTSEPPTASRTTDATTRAARSLCTTAAWHESADASPGGQLTAEGLTMKPHIYRLRGSWYCIKYNFSRQNERIASPQRKRFYADAGLSFIAAGAW